MHMIQRITSVLSAPVVPPDPKSDLRASPVDSRIRPQKKSDPRIIPLGGTQVRFLISGGLILEPSSQNRKSDLQRCFENETPENQESDPPEFLSTRNVPIN